MLVWPKGRWRNLSFSIVSDYLALKEEDLNQAEVTHQMLNAIIRILSLIISLVDERTYIDKFYKELTANDLGKTGSHQAGIAIPKNKHLFFGLLDETKLNPDVKLDSLINKIIQDTNFVSFITTINFMAALEMNIVFYG